MKKCGRGSLEARVVQTEARRLLQTRTLLLAQITNFALPSAHALRSLDVLQVRVHFSEGREKC